jgi:hypothetical protein
MYGLQRIIQIDNYASGLKQAIEIDGHAALTGENGAGKSSTLDLLLVFYGAEPRSVAAAGGGHKRFVDYYLPNPTSILVFEYLRDDGLNCAVLYRHPAGNKPAYRFLKSGYAEARFSAPGSDGRSTYLPGQDLKHHWRNLGLDCSTQIENVIDYRAIIQNTARDDARDAATKALAALYGVCTRGDSMRHMELVVTALAKRDAPLFDRMRHMLASIMESGHVAMPEPPLHDKDAGLVADIRSLRGLDTVLKAVGEVSDLADERGEVAARLKKHIGMSKALLKKAHADVDKHEQELRALEGEKANTTTEWERQFQSMNDRVIAARGHLDASRQKLDSLDRQRADFEAACTASKAADLDVLDGYIEEAKTARQRYESLLEDVKQEEAEKLRHVAAEQERHAKFRDEVNAAIAAKEEQKGAVMARFGERREALHHDQLAEVEAAQRERAPQREALVEERAHLRAAVEGGGPTEDERLETTKAEGRVVEEERRVAQALEARETCEARRRDCATRRDEAEGARRRASGAHDDAKRELDRLHALAFAENGTWLRLLREHDPDWTERLGRVIDPELLKSKVLDPKRTDDGGASLYGWALNLDALPVPMHARSEAELREEYARLETRVHQCDDRVAEAEKALRARSRDLEEAVKAVQAAARAWTQGQGQLERARAHVKKVAGDVADAVAERRRAARQRLDKVAQRLDAFDADARRAQDEIKTRFGSLLNELRASEAIEIQQVQDAIDREALRRDEGQKQYEARVRAIQEDFDRACKDAGVDETRLREAREAAMQAEARAAEVNSFAGEVAEYRAWLDSEWSRLDALQDDERERQSELSLAERALADAKLRREDAVSRFAERSRELSRDLTRCREEAGALGDLAKELAQSDFDDVPPAALVEDRPPVALFVEEARADQARYKDVRARLMKAIGSLVNNLERHCDGEAMEAWMLLKNEVCAQQGLGSQWENSDRFLLNLPPALEAFRDKHYPAIRRTRLEILRVTAQKLAAYYEKMASVDRQIKGYSRKFTQAIDELLVIESLSELGFTLESRISEIECWDELREFLPKWRAWREADDDGLPDDDLLELVGSVITTLEQIRMGHALRDCFGLKLVMVENGNHSVLRTREEFENSASTGLRKIALMLLFIAIARMLCPNRDARLHFPVDELAELSPANIKALFDLFDRHGVIAVSAAPDIKYIDAPFKYRHELRYRQPLRRIRPRLAIPLKTRILAEEQAS